ncbi:SURF1 family protein [uncultured Croceicoccus sp.]|uniref:SURF1 family protein n=1 Tax=uncultured Croceicoccus sp. TaxID=1295329 RepID=UPI00344FDC94
MMRRIPVFATLVVGVAVAVMIALGIWQYRRAQEKTAIIAYYEQAQGRSEPVPFPQNETASEAALYRQSQVDCAEVIEQGAIGATARDGRKGWGQVAQCRLRGGGEAEVMLGWVLQPGVRPWDGGVVTGTVAPAGMGVRLVADPPQAGLAPLARPDPHNLPNNHISYMVQWFFFAATALVIYGLALRARLARKDDGR